MARASYTESLVYKDTTIKYAEVSGGYKFKTKKGTYAFLQERTMFNPNRKTKNDYTIVQYAAIFRDKKPVIYNEYTESKDWKTVIAKCWEEQ